MTAATSAMTAAAMATTAMTTAAMAAATVAATAAALARRIPAEEQEAGFGRRRGHGRGRHRSRCGHHLEELLQVRTPPAGECRRLVRPSLSPLTSKEPCLFGAIDAFPRVRVHFVRIRAPDERGDTTGGE